MEAGMVIFLLQVVLGLRFKQELSPLTRNASPEPEDETKPTEHVHEVLGAFFDQHEGWTGWTPGVA